jgi:poly(U)-specific endoribonuclease
MYLSSLFAIILISVGCVRAQISDEEIRAISDQIWQGDINRMSVADVQYDPLTTTRFFTSVNEARFTGTYERFITLLDYYNPQLGFPDFCETLCETVQNAFLDAILEARPLVFLHNFLFGKGLASQTLAGFRTELRQYFFTRYSRTGGELDSSGFEHVFAGEINEDGTQVIGFNNWIKLYQSEKIGFLIYGPYQGMCPNEVYTFGFNWLDAQKQSSTMFIRTSPEVEVALYTLCLLTRPGAACPVRRNGEDYTMTVLARDGLARTIDTAYPNC